MFSVFQNSIMFTRQFENWIWCRLSRTYSRYFLHDGLEKKIFSWNCNKFRLLMSRRTDIRVECLYLLYTTQDFLYRFFSHANIRKCSQLMQFSYQCWLRFHDIFLFCRFAVAFLIHSFLKLLIFLKSNLVVCFGRQQ